MKYYFAHPISIYNTKKEKVLFEMLSSSLLLTDPIIVNPNSEYNEASK